MSAFGAVVNISLAILAVRFKFGVAVTAYFIILFDIVQSMMKLSTENPSV